MLKFWSFILLCLVTFGPHSGEGVVVEFRSDDPFAGTRILLDNVVSQLQNVASNAGQAVSNFTTGIQSQVQEFREDLTSEVNQVKEILQEVISNATVNVSSATAGVLECITDTNKSIETAINGAVLNATSCADNGLGQITTHVSELISVAKQAADAADEVKTQAAECATSSGNIFIIGKCLGSLLWQTNVKAATITGQSALLVARINLSLAALPSTLSMCVATKFTQAALGAGQLAATLAKCSTNAVISG